MSLTEAEKCQENGIQIIQLSPKFFQPFPALETILSQVGAGTGWKQETSVNSLF